MYQIAALADPNMRLTKICALQDAALARGVVLSVFSAGMPEQIEPAINDAKRSGVGALNVLGAAPFLLKPSHHFREGSGLALACHL